MIVPVAVQALVAWVARLKRWISRRRTEEFHSAPHQVPSAYQSLLSGFCPVGAVIEEE